MADLIAEFVTFTGKSSDDAENFIQSVNIQAFKAQKLKDTEWITGFASTAFSGKALRWYRRLPVTTRQDWELLQEAILDHQWEDDLGPSCLVTPAAAPTPALAAAPPAPPAHPAPGALIETLSSLSLTGQSTRTARIRILAEDPTCNGYLRLSTNQGLGYSEPHISNAPLIKWSSSSSPTTLEIQGSTGPSARYNMLCGQHLNDNEVSAKFSEGQRGRVMITAALSSPGHSSRTLGEILTNNDFGRSYVHMWHVLEDLSLLPVVDQLGGE
ncbi:hypothetical protein FRC04_011260 [Tulasnella sp. 424]|nr:hypothetical protein FRC04_011260 [Tulasnella sp. 424]KAG8971802.1 hypothetical protein FRC05_010761 [Tulasnella sp. 425]